MRSPLIDADELRAQLVEHGTVFPVPVCRPDEAASLLGEMERYLARPRTPDVEQLALGPKLHLFHEPVRDFLLQPSLVRLVQTLLDSEDVALWASSAFVNRPEQPVWTGWHQDGVGYPLEGPQEAVVRVWIALTPCTADTGTMAVARGSHRFGYLQHAFNDRSMLNEGICVRVDPDVFEQARVVLEPGEAEFHTLATVHRSRPNVSSTARINIAADFVAPAASPRPGVVDDATLVAGDPDAFAFAPDPQVTGGIDPDPAGVESAKRRLALLSRCTIEQIGTELIVREG